MLGSLSKSISFIFLLWGACLVGAETLFCPFDIREWKIGFEDQSEGEKIIELVLKDDTIINWKELFTVQIFDHVSMDGNGFLKALEEATKKELPSPKNLRFNVLDAEKNIFESSFLFSQEAKENELDNDEFNIGRILKGKTAIYYIRYSAKEQNLFNENKNNWVQRLKEAYLSDQVKDTQMGKGLIITPSKILMDGKELVFQDDYQFIEEEKMGYAMTLPKDWKIEHKKHEKEGEILTFASPDKTIHGKVILQHLKDAQAANSAPKSFFEGHQKKHAQSKIVKEGKVKNIVGQEGDYTIFEEGSKKMWMSCFSTGKRLFCLEISTTTALFNQNKNQIEDLIVNFEVQPQLIEQEIKR